MATFDQIRPAAAPAGTGAFFSNLLGNIVAWNDRRVTVKMLRNLTERELTDIGLSRADIENFASIRR